MRRLIHFAGNSVAVEYDHPLAARLLDLIVYPFASPGTDEPSAVFRFDVETGPTELYRIRQNGELTYEGSSRVDAAEMLLSQICHQLAYDSRNGMLFHAAGLAKNGSGILMPGGIAAGKSTFTAWMVSLGFEYLSDELVYIPWETCKMVSFPRPLHLKKPSRPILSAILDYEISDERLLCGSFSDLVSPALLARPVPYSQPDARLILLPRYQAGAELSWQPLSAAQAGLELLQCLINARNLPDYGFSEAAQLARLVRAIKITYSLFSQVHDRIMDLEVE